MKPLKSNIAKVRAEMSTALNCPEHLMTKKLLNEIAKLVVNNASYRGQGHSDRLVAAAKIAPEVWVEVVYNPVKRGWVTMYPVSHKGRWYNLEQRSLAQIVAKLTQRGLVAV